VPLRKTAVSFPGSPCEIAAQQVASSISPGEGTAACLSTLSHGIERLNDRQAIPWDELLLTSSKDRARSVSEAFFLSSTPSILVFKDEKFENPFLLSFRNVLTSGQPSLFN
jgi:hypothetical protein